MTREGVSLRERTPRGARPRTVGLAIVVALVLTRVVLAVIRRASAALIVRLARVLAGPLASRGVIGRLARENTIRHPGRTAVTAAALMIGLALVSFVSILAAGTKASINTAIDASFAGELIIENSSQAGNVGIPAGIPAALAAIPGIRQVTPIAFTQGRVRGLHGTQSVTAVDSVGFPRVYRIDWDRGSSATLASLGTTGTVLTKAFANAHHLRVGERLAVLTPSGRTIALVVRGIATDNARLLAQLTITIALARSAFSQRTDARVGRSRAMPTLRDRRAMCSSPPFNPRRQPAPIPARRLAAGKRYCVASASRMSTRAARRAGHAAAPRPASAESTKSTTIVTTGITSTNPVPVRTVAASTRARTIPSAMPSTPPISAVMSDSRRTIWRIWRRVAPIARSIPSSRVRSKTESTSVLTIPKSDTITESASST